MNMKTFLKKSMLTAFVGALVFGCYPAGPEYVEDLDVVYSTYDDQYDFKSKSTYAMPDEIVVDVEIDKNGDTTYVYMKDVYALPILAQIESNMTDYGWTRVGIDENPNVLLTPAGMKSTTYFYSYWYSWWYGGYYPGWGGWYYPPYYTVSSYTTGSVILTLSDPNYDTPISKSQSIWLAAMNGLLGSNDINRAKVGIDQAFKQSPYLNTK